MPPGIADGAPMRILYVLPSLQHPTIQRGGLRHYHFLRALARRHAITLLALAPSGTTAEARAEVEALVERCLLFPVAEPATGGAGRPGALRRLRRALRLRAALRATRRAFLELARRERFDVVLFHGKPAYPVIRGFRALPVVADFCDATSMRLREQLRFAPYLERPWRLWRHHAMRRLERELLDQACRVAFISPRDRAAVLGPTSRAAVIPNGIDLAYWTRRRGAGRAERIVFTGVMSYAPNEDAALLLIEQLWPVLRASRPALELFVVGRDPSPAVIEAGRRAAGVTVTGWVDDVRPYLEEASVYVAPIRYASGLQNKVLEALAMGVPVVTTPIVAEGLRGDGGGDDAPPVRAAEVGGMAAAILALLDDEPARRGLAAAGRRFVEAEFDWGRAAERLEGMCLEAVGHAPASGAPTVRQSPRGRAPSRPELIEHA